MFTRSSTIDYNGQRVNTLVCKLCSKFKHSVLDLLCRSNVMSIMSTWSTLPALTCVRVRPLQGTTAPLSPSGSGRALSAFQSSCHSLVRPSAAGGDDTSKARAGHPCQRPARAKARAEAPARRAPGRRTP
jgi:hypothetical protein